MRLRNRNRRSGSPRSVAKPSKAKLAKLKAQSKKLLAEFELKLDVKTYDALQAMTKCVIAQGGKIINDAPLVEWKKKADKARGQLKRLRETARRRK